MYPFESLRHLKQVSLMFDLPSFRRLKQVALAAFGVGAIFTTQSASAAPSCHLPSGRTIASGKVAKLISVPTPSGPALFACIRRSGRKIPLDDSYANARLTGRWVAWERAGRPGRWRIAVYDLRTGEDRLVDGRVAAHKLFLTARGTVVWAQRRDEGPGSPLFANDTVDGRRLLDAAFIDTSTLRMAGRRVSWVSGDQERSAVVR